MSDRGWTEYITSEEEANMGKCLETSNRYGWTHEEAEECESGNLCPKCPFENAGK